MQHRTGEDTESQQSVMLGVSALLVSCYSECSPGISRHLRMQCKQSKATIHKNVYIESFFCGITGK